MEQQFALSVAFGILLMIGDLWRSSSVFNLYETVMVL